MLRGSSCSQTSSCAVRVLLEGGADGRVLERRQLLDPEHRDVAGLGTQRAGLEIDRDLAAAEHDAGHVLRRTGNRGIVQHRPECALRELGQVG